jgi:hypothetical protein
MAAASLAVVTTMAGLSPGMSGEVVSTHPFVSRSAEPPRIVRGVRLTR